MTTTTSHAKVRDAVAAGHICEVQAEQIVEDLDEEYIVRVGKSRGINGFVTYTDDPSETVHYYRGHRIEKNADANGADYGDVWLVLRTQRGTLAEAIGVIDRHIARTRGQQKQSA